MTSTYDEGVSLVGCSVKGPKHENSDEPCQDAWCGYRLSDGHFVIAVGDGLGSASRSQEGSQLATRKMADALKEYLSRVDTIEREASEVALREAVVDTRQTVIDTAEQLGEKPSAFNTTLLAVVGGPSGLAGVAVGDGGIVYKLDGDNELLVPREMAVVDTEFANVTTPLQNDHWEDSFRVDYREEFDAVAVFSDGIDEFVWQGLDDVKDAFFEQVFDHVWTISDDDEAAEQLRDYLDNDHHRKYSSDDKTLAIGALERPDDAEETFEDGVDESEAESDEDSDRPSVNRVAEGVGSASAFQRPEAFEDRGVETTDGNHLELGEKLDDRTGATVYRVVGHDSLVMKLFAPTVCLGDEMEPKVRTMIANPPVETVGTADRPTVPRFAWPTTVVETTDGEFLGYTMPFPPIERSSDALEYARAASAEPADPTSGFLERVSSLVVDSGETAVDRRYRPALDLARALDTLHQSGVAVGGLHHSYVRVVDGAVSLVNCDSFHVKADDETFAGDGATSRYGPPDDRLDTLEAVRRADRFGLGVLVFQLIMDGIHPFRAQGSEAVDGPHSEVIQSNPFPYRDPRPGQLAPPGEAPSYENVPTELRTLFETCFVEGKHRPGLRPTASEWVSTLESLDAGVQA